MNEIIEKIKGNVIISVQASFGEPFYDISAKLAMMKACVLGGACALRVASTRDIKEAKANFKIPIIGITKPKIIPENFKDLVYITPNVEDARSLLDAGADIVAFDCTKRNKNAKDIVELIHSYDRLAMADISTFEEAKAASLLDVDIVSTTLSGYTSYSCSKKGPDFELLTQIVENLDVPVILEGRIWSPYEVKKAFEIGATSVVIGSAVSRPSLIVERFIVEGKV